MLSSAGMTIEASLDTRRHTLTLTDTQKYKHRRKHSTHACSHACTQRTHVHARTLAHM